METHKQHQNIEAAQAGIIQNLKTSWNLILDSWKLTLLALINDLAYFFFFSWLSTWTVETLSAPLNNIYGIAGDNISNLAKNLSNEEAASAIMANYEGFMSAYQVILKTALLFLIGSLLLWIIFQFMAWVLAHLITKRSMHAKKTPHTKSILHTATHSQTKAEPQTNSYVHIQSTSQQNTISQLKTISRNDLIHYFKRFSILSIAGMIVVAGILYASMRLAMWINVSQLGQFPQTATSILVAFLLFATLYILYCGYCAGFTAQRGATFILSVKHTKQMLGPFIIAVLMAYAGGFILAILLPTNAILGAAFGLIVVGPSFTFGRVLMIVAGKDGSGD